MERREIKEEPVEDSAECSVQDELLISVQAKLVALGLNNGEDQITLKVQSQDGEELYYRMAKNQKLGFLMKDFCRRKDLAFETMRFLYDGSRVREIQTPQELKMEDDDIIDCNSEMIGG